MDRGRDGRTQLAWVVTACVAVFAQAVPRSLCLACDQPCCAERAAGRVAAAATAAEPEATPHSVGGCPRCAATAGCRPVETSDASDRPCRCTLEARQDEPLATSRSTLVTVGAGEAAAVATVPAIVPPVLGVSREYLAASLAVPIRPPRILFGVRRN